MALPSKSNGETRHFEATRTSESNTANFGSRCIYGLHIDLQIEDEQSPITLVAGGPQEPLSLSPMLRTLRYCSSFLSVLNRPSLFLPRFRSSDTNANSVPAPAFARFYTRSASCTVSPIALFRALSMSCLGCSMAATCASSLCAFPPAC